MRSHASRAWWIFRIIPALQIRQMRRRPRILHVDHSGAMYKWAAYVIPTGVFGDELGRAGGADLKRGPPL